MFIKKKLDNLIYLRNTEKLKWFWIIKVFIYITHWD